MKKKKICIFIYNRNVNIKRRACTLLSQAGKVGKTIELESGALKDRLCEQTF